MKLPVNLSLDSLSERDLKTLKIGALLAVLLLIYVVFQLDSSVSSAHKRVIKKADDLAWMQAHVADLASANNVAQGGGQSLLVIVDRSAHESGLGSALAGSEPSGQGGLSVRLQKAPFDTMILWLARLSQQNGIRVDSASIENAGSPGLVNAAIVLRAD